MFDGARCEQLTDPGWSADCGVFVSSTGKAAWVIEYHNTVVGDEYVEKRASLYRAGAAGRWLLALRAADVDGQAWEAVSVCMADVARDGNRKAVFWFAPRTGKATSVLDVVEASGKVVVHIQEDRMGRQFRISPDSGVEYWFRDAGGWHHRVVRYERKAWRFTVSERVPEPLGLVPTSPRGCDPA